jgi:hypothetical protein
MQILGRDPRDLLGRRHHRTSMNTPTDNGEVGRLTGPGQRVMPQLAWTRRHGIRRHVVAETAVLADAGR